MEIASSPSLAARRVARATMACRLFLPLVGPPAGLFLPLLPKQPSLRVILARTFVISSRKTKITILFFCYRNALPLVLYIGAGFHLALCCQALCMVRRLTA